MAASGFTASVSHDSTTSSTSDASPVRSSRRRVFAAAFVTKAVFTPPPPQLGEERHHVVEHLSMLYQQVGIGLHQGPNHTRVRLAATHPQYLGERVGQIDPARVEQTVHRPEGGCQCLGRNVDDGS